LGKRGHHIASKGGKGAEATKAVMAGKKVQRQRSRIKRQTLSSR